MQIECRRVSDLVRTSLMGWLTTGMFLWILRSFVSSYCWCYRLLASTDGSFRRQLVLILISVFDNRSVVDCQPVVVVFVVFCYTSGVIVDCCTAFATFDASGTNVFIRVVSLVFEVVCGLARVVGGYSSFGNPVYVVLFGHISFCHIDMWRCCTSRSTFGCTCVASFPRAQYSAKFCGLDLWSLFEFYSRSEVSLVLEMWAGMWPILMLIK